jgi:tRNA A37 threonylcarbamoyladenosine synthetase subunit TsaC/SUA5/YrdC
MKRLRIHPDNPQGRYLKMAADVLSEGGLLIYPTDSVYGLGCDLFNKNAVEKIYQHKGNDKQTAQLHLSRFAGISEYAYVSNSAYKIMAPSSVIPHSECHEFPEYSEKRKTSASGAGKHRVPGAAVKFRRPIIFDACLHNQDFLSDLKNRGNATRADFS